MLKNLICMAPEIPHFKCPGMLGALDSFPIFEILVHRAAKIPYGSDPVMRGT